MAKISTLCVRNLPLRNRHIKKTSEKLFIYVMVSLTDVTYWWTCTHWDFFHRCNWFYSRTDIYWWNLSLNIFFIRCYLFHAVDLFLKSKYHLDRDFGLIQWSEMCFPNALSLLVPPILSTCIHWTRSNYRLLSHLDKYLYTAKFKNYTIQ